MREAPSLVLASRLLAEGAEVRGWDPVADARDLLPGVEAATTPLEAVDRRGRRRHRHRVAGAREARDAGGPEAMRTPLIVDGRNLLDPAAARAAGFVYEGIGRAASPSRAAQTPSRPAPA